MSRLPLFFICVPPLDRSPQVRVWCLSWGCTLFFVEGGQATLTGDLPHHVMDGGPSNGRRSGHLVGNMTDTPAANSFSSCTQCQGWALNCWLSVNLQVSHQIPFPLKGLPQPSYRTLASFKCPLLQHSVYFPRNNVYLHLSCCFVHRSPSPLRLKTLTSSGSSMYF